MNVTPTKVALLGATGRIGGHVMKLALERGHEVHALARTPSKLAAQERLHIYAGDATKVEDVKKIVDAAEVLVVCVGVKSKMISILVETATSVLAASPKRVVALSNIGIRDASPTLSFLMGLGAGRAYIHGLESFDKALRAAPFPCTVVRPTGFNNKPGNGKYRVTERKGMDPFAMTISCEDVSLFLTDAISNTEWDGKAVQLFPK